MRAEHPGSLQTHVLVSFITIFQSVSDAWTEGSSPHTLSDNDENDAKNNETYQYCASRARRANGFKFLGRL